jgi:hypothetical protein
MKAGVIEGNPDVAGESGCCVLSHWSKVKLKLFRLLEFGVKQERHFGVS